MKYDTIEDGESTPLQGGSSNTAPSAAPNKTTPASSSTAIVRAFMIGTTAGALLMTGHSKMMNSSSNIVDNVYGTMAATTADSLVDFSSESYVGKKKKKKKRRKYEGNIPTPAPTDPSPTSLPTTMTNFNQIIHELNMTSDNIIGTCNLFVHVLNLLDKANFTLGESGNPSRLLIKNAYYNGQQPPKALLDISGSVLGCDLVDTDFSLKPKPLAELTNVGIATCAYNFCDIVNSGRNPNATFPCGKFTTDNLCTHGNNVYNATRSGIFWDMYLSTNTTFTVEDNASIGTLLCHNDQFGSLAPDACAN